MKVDFEKVNGLVPAVIQDAETAKVLMLGYMNEEALEKTEAEGKVTFFSRTKNRLWTKGEESGNFLLVKEILNDCDNDTLLIKVKPVGPTCHKGTDTCWGEENTTNLNFIEHLAKTIHDRVVEDDPKSYTNKLIKRGINKVAQKVGEEAVEVVIEAKDDNTELFLNESADLLYHYLVLLEAKGHTLTDVVDVLRSRHK
ncbi:bifunctional phosphoribosyl-AMP cyclohydrolase/phosphoribosyl-ATP diphosphatase HisIE [Persicobacter psychrovividus]|uniref:Histidine biosynthesis bifunctional protein HisIE n=1 Tax=Persicobacter psychrovividus TaxID=387638 RepID=A0ABN6L7L4_9BACT|nr:histidine biosynthesis bifunctional protein HisIE [Persicobacter psychrovividus]